MRRLWVTACALLLAACAAHQAPSCSPCPGPGFVERGLPATTRPAIVRTCVADEPCQTTKVGRSPQPQSLEFLPLATQGDWASYDGKEVTVTVRIADRRWRGTGDLVYEPDDGGTCACPHLSADVTFSAAG